MSINVLFTIIGVVALVGAIGLFTINYRTYDTSLVDKPGLLASLHLGLMVLAAIGIAFLILSISITNCPNCNNITDRNYCDECGYQVRMKVHPQKSFCSECGANINADANFCGQCGNEIKE